ncbi:MAG: TM2 domain-containing protein [Cryobacterium sp.]
MPEGNKSFIVTLLLSYFLGFFGADRFYLGKTSSARWKLLTLGGFGYWYLIDLFMTLFGAQRDARGLRLAGHDKHKRTGWVVFGAVFGSVILINVVAATISAAFDSQGPTAFGWVLLAILAATAALGAWSLRHRASTYVAMASRMADSTPQRIRARIARIMALRQLYLVTAAAGDPVAPAVITQVDSVVTNLTDLFRRLSVKAYKEQRGLVQAEYEDKLDTLAAALDRDFLLDMLANPRLWDNPEQRIRDVLGALEAVDAQILRNIRQINARRGLVFQVELDDLMGPRKAQADWQRDFDEASGVE